MTFNLVDGGAENSGQYSDFLTLDFWKLCALRFGPDSSLNFRCEIRKLAYAEMEWTTQRSIQILSGALQGCVISNYEYLCWRKHFSF